METNYEGSNTILDITLFMHFFLPVSFVWLANFYAFPHKNVREGITFSGGLSAGIHVNAGVSEFIFWFALMTLGTWVLPDSLHRIPPLKSHGQVLEEELFPGVLSDNC